VSEENVAAVRRLFAAFQGVMSATLERSLDEAREILDPEVGVTASSGAPHSEQYRPSALGPPQLAHAGMPQVYARVAARLGGGHATLCARIDGGCGARLSDGHPPHTALERGPRDSGT
jgi:hypothetical protein